MKALRWSVTVLGCFALAALASAASADEKKATNKEKIVGIWAVTKSAGGLPPKANLEFTKDGKLKISIKIEDKSLTIDGTYEVKDDKLTVIMKAPGGKEQKETMTIKSLTDKKLVTVDTKGKEDEFEKKK
jgi:uncharacterized protein (TIGR03066 family)